LASPTDQRALRDLLEGARREDAGHDHGRATITAKRLAAALELQGPPTTPLAVRDRAIVLLTFASGRRRAEIAGLNIEDLDFSRPGFLIVTIRKSKTDQGGAGQFVAVPRLEHGPCAVAALEAWLVIQTGEAHGKLVFGMRSLRPISGAALAQLRCSIGLAAAKTRWTVLLLFARARGARRNW
jgi:site-specific recombinase XerC